MRSSGILMHITSLPSPYGVGTLGKGAYKFVDFLESAGQKLWQILPLNPTGYGDSPYQSCSSFAGNHYLIDPELLRQQGLLDKNDLETVTWTGDPEKVDYGWLYNTRLSLLEKAFSRFTDNDALDAFCRDNGVWLSDFALFLALKEEQGGKSWTQWPKELKNRNTEAIWNARRRLEKRIRLYCFIQFIFYKQWDALKAYANQKGISLIGDVPIYVPFDSVEVWSTPELFCLDAQMNPEAVAGCPPDAFSDDGQLWGNPLYHWERHKKDGYSWWINRLGAAARLYDMVRLDHFRAFEAYWSVPYGDKTAKNGQWLKGPGLEFFYALQKALPKLDLIAEDLGFLTPEVLQLRDDAGLPGMKVLGFAFDSREPSDYLPYKYPVNSVCYTGTHDNMTTRQWFDTASKDAVQYACEYMALSKKEGYVWGVIRTAMSSNARICIIPMQDYLELGAQARMNFPGTTGGNWCWRMKQDALTKTLSEKIRKISDLYGRANNPQERLNKV